MTGTESILKGTRILLLALSVVFLVTWAFDRRAPFRVVGYDPIVAKRGESAAIRADVRRDMRRDCSVSFTRFLYDSKGVRFDIGDVREMSAATIRELNSRSPNELKFAVQMPPKMAAGEAELVTELKYVCNPLHVAWPIVLLMKNKIEVLA